MKSVKIIYVLASLAILLSTTSCLDEGGNLITLASQPAVVKMNDGQKVLLLKGGDKIYASGLDSNADLEAGDCGLVDFDLDYSDVSNIHAEDSGFYTASNLSFTKYNKYPLSEHLSDTSGVYVDEKMVSSIYEKSLILDNNLFLFTNHTLEFDTDTIDLSYNKGETVLANDEGKRVYAFYLRFIGDTISTQKEIKVSVFDLASFVAEKGKIEQEANQDSLYFSIKYVSAIKSDLTPTWSSSQAFAIGLSEK